MTPPLPSDPRDRVPSSAELTARLPPWGERSVGLGVGSLEVEVRGLDDRLVELISRHYERFLRTGPPRGTARTLEVARAPVGAYLHLPRGEGILEEARVASRALEGRLEVWSYFFAARYPRDASECRLLLCDADELDLSQAMENCLRFFLSAAALDAGGFVLHSAGVVHRDRAWLFFGPSGAGKSTTASRAPKGAELLGDDLVLVEPSGDAWRACGVPFRGSFRGLPPNSRACAPLAAALRLLQDDENRLETVPRIVQVAELLGEVPFLLEDEELRSRAGDVLEGFAAGAVVRRLHLRDDGTFWSLLDDIA